MLHYLKSTPRPPSDDYLWHMISDKQTANIPAYIEHTHFAMNYVPHTAEQNKMISGVRWLNDLNRRLDKAMGTTMPILTQMTDARGDTGAKARPFYDVSHEATKELFQAEFTKHPVSVIHGSYHPVDFTFHKDNKQSDWISPVDPGVIDKPVHVVQSFDAHEVLNPFRENAKLLGVYLESRNITTLLISGIGADHVAGCVDGAKSHKSARRPNGFLTIVDPDMVINPDATMPSRRRTYTAVHPDIVTREGQVAEVLKAYGPK